MDGFGWMRERCDFTGSNQLDGHDTAAHDAARSVTTKMRLINAGALLGTRPRRIVGRELSITEPRTNSISVL